MIAALIKCFSQYLSVYTKLKCTRWHILSEKLTITFAHDRPYASMTDEPIIHRDTTGKIMIIGKKIKVKSQVPVSIGNRPVLCTGSGHYCNIPHHYVETFRKCLVKCPFSSPKSDHRTQTRGIIYISL